MNSTAAASSAQRHVKPNNHQIFAHAVTSCYISQPVPTHSASKHLSRLLCSELAVGVCDLDAELSSALDDLLAVLGAHVVSDLSAVVPEKRNNTNKQNVSMLRRYLGMSTTLICKGAAFAQLPIVPFVPLCDCRCRKTKKCKYNAPGQAFAHVLVVHHQQLEVLDVVHLVLVEAVWQEVASALVRSCTTTTSTPSITLTLTSTNNTNNTHTTNTATLTHRIRSLAWRSLP